MGAGCSPCLVRESAAPGNFYRLCRPYPGGLLAAACGIVPAVSFQRSRPHRRPAPTSQSFSWGTIPTSAAAPARRRSVLLISGNLAVGIPPRIRYLFRGREISPSWCFCGGRWAPSWLCGARSSIWHNEWLFCHLLGIHRPDGSRFPLARREVVGTCEHRFRGGTSRRASHAHDGVPTRLVNGRRERDGGALWSSAAEES